MSAARLRLVECRAILGGEYDAMRAVWDHQATSKDRRLLLAMAGRQERELRYLADKAWGDLSVDNRESIRAGLRRFRAWSEKVA